MGTRSGAVHLHGVETPRPLVNAQKDDQKTIITRRHQETRQHGAGEEESKRSSTGGQGLEARPLLVSAGTGLQVESGRG